MKLPQLLVAVSTTLGAVLGKTRQPALLILLWLALLLPQSAAALIFSDCDFDGVLPKPKLLNCAQRYLDINQPGIAWEILEPQEIVYAGQPDYDYLLGLSAVESARTGQATLALERVVNLKPDFAGARYELARAYYYLGDYDLARGHYEQVLTESPPALLANKITSALNSIERRLWNSSSFLSGHFKIGGGYDQNATNGPDTDTLFVAGLGNLNLSDNTKANASGFGHAGLATQWNKPLSPGLTLSAGLDVRSNNLFDLDDLNRLQYGANTRLTATGKKQRSQLELKSSRSDLDGKFNNRTHSASLNITRKLSQRTVTHFAARGAQVRYNSQLAIQDVNQLVVALGFGIRPRNFKADLIAIYGDYHAINHKRYSRRLLGGSLKLGAMRWGPAVFSINLTHLRSDYADLHFGTKRKDVQNSVTAVMELENIPAPMWSIRNWWRYIDNESTVPLYDYSGLQAGLELVRKFK